MDLAPLSRRARTSGRSGRLALVAAGAVLVAASCSGGGGSSTSSKGAADSHGSTVALQPGQVTVAAAGAAGTLSNEERDAIIKTLDQYVNTATMRPLRGKPVGDLTTIFTAEAAPSLTGTNRDALVDEGIDPAISPVKSSALPVPLTALSDPAGAINLVGATLDVTATTTNAAGPVAVHRVGEMVLRRDGDTWKINSYRILVDRNGAGLQGAPTTSTSSS